MKAKIILLLFVFITSFSCNKEEIFIDKSGNTFEIEKSEDEASKDLRAKALEKLIEKYGGAIENIERNVDSYSNTAQTSHADSGNEIPSIEIAFPDKNRDIVTFKTGVSIEICDSFYVFQGDIILSEEQVGFLAIESDDADIYIGDENDIQTRGSVRNISKYRWPYNTIYYSIKYIKNAQTRRDILDAMAEWERACPFLKFIQKTEGLNPKKNGMINTQYVMEQNYIEFIQGSTSYSALGRQELGQTISIATWGDKGTAMHEIGHALGLIHEHSRPDRDNDIIVITSNIKSNKRHNYDKINGTLSTTGTTDSRWAPFVIAPQPFGTPYTTVDFNSIMMYSSWVTDEMAIDPSKPVMLRKSDNQPFEYQRSYISNNDRLAIYYFYNVPIPNTITFN